MSTSPAPPRHAPRPPQFVQQWGIAGDGNGQFSRPGGSAVSPNGRVLYVMDRWNYRCGGAQHRFSAGYSKDTPASLGALSNTEQHCCVLRWECPAQNARVVCDLWPQTTAL